MIARRLIYLSLLSLFIIFTGCYTTYSGVYYYDRDNYLLNIKTLEMETALYETLKPLGFRDDDSSRRDVLSLQLKPELALPAYADLGGSNAHIYIALDPDRTITIRIRDFDNYNETEFMKVLKQKIEHMLRIQFDIQEPKFRRAPDFMGP